MSPVPFSQKAAKGCFPLKPRKGRLHEILETEKQHRKRQSEFHSNFEGRFQEKSYEPDKEGNYLKTEQITRNWKRFLQNEIDILINKFDSLKEDLNNWWSIGDSNSLKMKQTKKAEVTGNTRSAAKGKWSCFITQLHPW